MTGQWLYIASRRAKGPGRLHTEHEADWWDLSDGQRKYWNRFAAMVKRRVLAKGKR